MFEELLRVCKCPQLLKRGKVRVVLLVGLAVVVHRFSGKPTRTMEVEVAIERLLVERLDLSCLRMMLPFFPSMSAWALVCRARLLVNSTASLLRRSATTCLMNSPYGIGDLNHSTGQAGQATVG